MDERNLIGWLVFYRHQSVNDVPRVSIPTHIHQAFVERGWLEITGEKDWEGDYPARFTERGLSVSDLHAPEWGIDPIPEDSHA